MPQKPDLRRELAELLAETGQKDQALTQARLAVQLEPADAKAAALLKQLQGK
jgi:protein involved in temperature-dependent protein secretion